MSNQTPSATREIWHRRLVPRSLDHKTLQYLSSKVSDISISEPKSILSKLCGICALGRQHKQAVTRTRKRVTELLQVIQTDLCGPMQTPTRVGERYFIAFTDEKSGRVTGMGTGWFRASFDTHEVILRFALLPLGMVLRNTMMNRRWTRDSGNPIWTLTMIVRRLRFLCYMFEMMFSFCFRGVTGMGTGWF